MSVPSSIVIFFCRTMSLCETSAIDFIDEAFLARRAHPNTSDDPHNAFLHIEFATCLWAPHKITDVKQETREPLFMHLNWLD